VTGMRFVILTGAFTVWAFTAPVANAFEQTPLPPATAQPPAAAAPALAPNLSLDDQVKQSQSEEKEPGGLKLPGLGKVKIPKLNFGLDLMYGNPESDDTELGFSSSPSSDEDDLRIMGKMKRRF